MFLHRGDCGYHITVRTGTATWNPKEQGLREVRGCPRPRRQHLSLLGSKAWHFPDGHSTHCFSVRPNISSLLECGDLRQLSCFVFVSASDLAPSVHGADQVEV